MNVQVAVKPSSGSMVEIELVATNTGSPLALHWGALQPGRSEWVVPPAGMRLPEGTTRTHDDAAFRTPFKTVCYGHRI
jgi:alpha-glucan,water dikinase